MKYLPSLDGLRAIAACMVLIHHFSQYIVHGTDLSSIKYFFGFGEYGLVIFFVLSGYLIERLATKQVVDLRGGYRFFLRRVFRIFPEYLAVLLVSALVFGLYSNFGSVVLYGEEGVGFASDLKCLASNLFLIQTFIPSCMLTGIEPAWSLTVEMTFYVFVAFFYIVMRTVRRGPVTYLVRYTLAFGMISTAVISNVLGGILDNSGWATGIESFWGHTWHAVFSRSLLVHGLWLGVGLLAAVLVEKRTIHRAMVELTLLHALTWILLSAFSINMGNQFVFSYVTCAFILLSNKNKAQWLSAKSLTFVGERSYGLYLWHMPAILWVSRQEPLTPLGGSTLILQFLIVFGSSLAAAHLSFKFIGRPMARFGRKLYS